MSTQYRFKGCWIRTGILFLAAPLLLLSFSLITNAKSTQQIAFLKKVDDSINIWIADLDSPTNARQITYSRGYIPDFDVDSAGERIAFVEIAPVEYGEKIKLLELESGKIVTLQDCEAVEMMCSDVSWQPYGHFVTYEATPRSESLSHLIWLINVDSSESRPLLKGYWKFIPPVYTHAQWVNDGSKVAFLSLDRIRSGYVSNLSRIGIYSLGEKINHQNPYYIEIDVRNFVLSPDGSYAVISQLKKPSRNETNLSLVNIESQRLIPITNNGKAFSDETPVAWSYDGHYIAFQRSYLNSASVRRETVIFDTTTQSITQRLLPGEFDIVSMAWSPKAYQLLIHGRQYIKSNNEIVATSDIWLHNLETNHTSLIIKDASSPHWIPDIY